MKKFLLIISVILGITWSVSAAEVASPPRRIISLAPSMTEILYALGLGDNIIGVTTYCDYPPEAKKKPKVGGMSNPSLEAVVAMKPDIVVMTTDGNPKEFEERLRSFKIKTYVFRARRLRELAHGIRELGQALGVPGQAEKLATEVESDIEKFSSSSLVQSLPTKDSIGGQSSRKVFFIVWPEPLIAAGPNTVIDDTLTLLGQENIAGAAGIEYPKYSLEEVIRQAPDIIFIGKSMGMDMRAMSEGILKRMTSVPAVKNGKVYFLSDRLFRLGPRVTKGIEEMAECLR